jgi:hypothetical protein
VQALLVEASNHQSLMALVRCVQRCF